MRRREADKSGDELELISLISPCGCCSFEEGRWAVVNNSSALDY